MKKIINALLLIFLIIISQGCVKSDFDILWEYMQVNGTREMEAGEVSYYIVYPARGNETVSYLIRVHRDRYVNLLIIENNRQYEASVGLFFDYGSFNRSASLFYLYESRFVEASGYDSGPRINLNTGTVQVNFNRYQVNNRSRDESNAEIGAENLIRFAKSLFENRIRIPLK
jgi:hypothetical protein